MVMSVIVLTPVPRLHDLEPRAGDHVVAVADETTAGARHHRRGLHRRMFMFGEGVKERRHEHVPGHPSQGIEVQVLNRCSPALARSGVGVIHGRPSRAWRWQLNSAGE